MGSDCKKSSMDVYAAFIILTAFLILFLTGCAFVPGGREPFGEKTYSQKEAQAAYERVCAELLQRNAGDPPFLIKAEYPAERYRDGKLYSYFSASLQEDGSCDGFSLEWQYVKKAEDETFDTTVCGISFQPWQGSASLQAERRLWAFGYDCGLTDEKVPALSVQEKEREHCRSVMAGMDFEALKGRASYKGDLMLQSVPDREILEFAE